MAGLSRPMRVVLAGLVLAAAVSGCLGGSDEGGEDAAAAVPTGGDAVVNSTVANRRPLAGLTADAVNGTAPLNVTFTLTFSDADQDELSWTLAMGNATLANGTSADSGDASSGHSTATAGNATGTGNATGNASAAGASRQVAHQFTEAGNYTVVLDVTDGTNSTSANITITVHPGGDATAAAGEGPVAEDDWAVFNADGTCDAKGEIEFEGEYVHERGDPPGTGYLLGGGTWIYEESNGIEGLQLGGADEVADYQACANPDTLIF